MEPKVMTAQEAAEVLNVSLSTIYNLRDHGHAAADQKASWRAVCR